MTSSASVFHAPGSGSLRALGGRMMVGSVLCGLLVWFTNASALAAPPAERAAPEATQMVAPTSPVTDTMAQRMTACAGCHGQEGKSTPSGFFPRIAGKPAGYLYNQLLNFREGRRTYPLMTYLVEHLSDDYLKEMAEYFASLDLPYDPPPRPQASAAELERGQQLVLKGDAGRKILACVQCHGENLNGRAPSIPGLLGLPRDYVVAQLGAWKTGNRHAVAPDCMADVAEPLTVADITAMASWLAAQPVPAKGKPASSGAATLKLPMPCGSDWR